MHKVEAPRERHEYVDNRQLERRRNVVERHYAPQKRQGRRENAVTSPSHRHNHER